MIYLSSFTFPDNGREFDVRLRVKQTCYDTMYPFFVLSARGVETLEFEPVTLLYGGNGSGKTTALNVIGETLSLARDTLYNRSSFFADYTALCRYELRGRIPARSRVITSDDVFDFMMNLRALNQGVDRNREELMDEYLALNDASKPLFQLKSMEDYEQLKKINQARHLTQSRFVRARGPGNVREQSNGESAFFYFTSKIEENGLYLLDEPENSLSPAKQLELVQFVEDSARFFGCQFIIATHSPFVLAMRGAKIYDLDSTPAAVRRWTELENVRAYYDFFKARREEFEE